MASKHTIRRAEASDIPDIIALVRAVVFEVYADLIQKNGEPPKGDSGRWTKAHVAELGGEIIGVGLTRDGFVSDLWVAKEHRSNDVGAAILQKLETDMKKNEHTTARLRVVADNNRARQFYLTHGWREIKIYPHERDGHLMVDMEKYLP